MNHIMDTQKVKEWINHRIDYWEEQSDKQILPATEEDIEGRGMLAAFYMIIEFLDGQRR